MSDLCAFRDFVEININRTYFGRIFWVIERKSHENYFFKLENDVANTCRCD